MHYCFGVDIGGTTIKMGIFKFDGESVDKWEIKTRTENLSLIHISRSVQAGTIDGAMYHFY